IIAESFLSFLGLGIQPPTPAWGNMLGEGRLYMLNSWWIATFPGLAIFITTLMINLMGNALRDWLDPHMKLRQAPPSNGARRVGSGGETRRKYRRRGTGSGAEPRAWRRGAHPRGPGAAKAWGGVRPGGRVTRSRPAQRGPHA